MRRVIYKITILEEDNKTPSYPKWYIVKINHGDDERSLGAPTLRLITKYIQEVIG